MKRPSIDDYSIAKTWEHDDKDWEKYANDLDKFIDQLYKATEKVCARQLTCSLFVPEGARLDNTPTTKLSAEGCTCGIPEPDADKECCTICGNLIHTEQQISAEKCVHPWSAVQGDGEMQPAKCLQCGKVLT